MSENDVKTYLVASILICEPHFTERTMRVCRRHAVVVYQLVRSAELTSTQAAAGVKVCR